MSDRTEAFQIDSLNVYNGGVIGLAYCPGRCGLDAQGHLWRRSMDKDVATIHNWGAAAVVSLVTLSELKNLAEEFPAYVTNPRGLGLFAAFDLPSQTERDKVIGGLLKNKLLMLPSGDDAIRFRPHLNVTSEDLKTSIDIIKSTIKATLN